MYKFSNFGSFLYREPSQVMRFEDALQDYVQKNNFTKILEQNAVNSYYISKLLRCISHVFTSPTTVVAPRPDTKSDGITRTME